MTIISAAWRCQYLMKYSTVTRGLKLGGLTEMLDERIRIPKVLEDQTSIKSTTVLVQTRGKVA